MQLSQSQKEHSGNFNNGNMQDIINRLVIAKSDISTHEKLINRIIEIKNEIAMTWDVYSKSYAWLFNFDLNNAEKQYVELVWCMNERIGESQ